MPGRLLRGLGRWWRRYRYRFVPWIALNLNHNPRTLRYVPDEFKDKVISDEDALGTLLNVFQALFINDFNKQLEILTVLPEPVQLKYQDLLSVQHPRVKLPQNRRHQPNVFKPEEILYKTLGFSIARATSSLISAGRGVFITKGVVPKGAVVSMYPGTVYQKHEPVFFQSIGNPFIFRCLDGVLIDGNDRGISRVVYRSCTGRDRLGPVKMCDSTWLTAEIQNPLAVGQYVNNCSSDRPMSATRSWTCPRRSRWSCGSTCPTSPTAIRGTAHFAASCWSRSGTSDREKSSSQTTTQLSADWLRWFLLSQLRSPRCCPARCASAPPAEHVL
ncbi:SET domain-containing protein 9 isoform 1-T1 [Molossus nigricans]